MSPQWDAFLRAFDEKANQLVEESDATVGQNDEAALLSDFPSTSGGSFTAACRCPICRIACVDTACICGGAIDESEPSTSGSKTISARTSVLADTEMTSGTSLDNSENSRDGSSGDSQSTYDHQKHKRKNEQIQEPQRRFRNYFRCCITGGICSEISTVYTPQEQLAALGCPHSGRSSTSALNPKQTFFLELPQIKNGMIAQRCDVIQWMRAVNKRHHRRKSLPPYACRHDETITSRDFSVDYRKKWTSTEQLPLSIEMHDDIVESDSIGTETVLNWKSLDILAEDKSRQLQRKSKSLENLHKNHQIEDIFLETDEKNDINDNLTCFDGYYDVPLEAELVWDSTKDHDDQRKLTIETEDEDDLKPQECYTSKLKSGYQEHNSTNISEKFELPSNAKISDFSIANILSTPFISPAKSTKSEAGDSSSMDFYGPLSIDVNLRTPPPTVVLNTPPETPKSANSNRYCDENQDTNWTPKRKNARRNLLGSCQLPLHIDILSPTTNTVSSVSMTSPCPSILIQGLLPSNINVKDVPRDPYIPYYWSSWQESNRWDDVATPPMKTGDDVEKEIENSDTEKLENNKENVHSTEKRQFSCILEKRESTQYVEPDSTVEDVDQDSKEVEEITDEDRKAYDRRLAWTKFAEATRKHRESNDGSTRPKLEQKLVQLYQKRGAAEDPNRNFDNEDGNSFGEKKQKSIAAILPSVIISKRTALDAVGGHNIQHLTEDTKISDIKLKHMDDRRLLWVSQDRFSSMLLNANNIKVTSYHKSADGKFTKEYADGKLPNMKIITVVCEDKSVLSLFYDKLETGYAIASSTLTVKGF